METNDKIETQSVEQVVNMDLPKAEVKSKNPTIWIILFALTTLISIVLAVLLVVFILQSNTLKATISENEKVISLLSDNVTTYENDIADYETENKSLQDDLKSAKDDLKSAKEDLKSAKEELKETQESLDSALLTIQDVFDFLSRNDAGKASNNFKADRAMVLVKKGQRTSFTLTAAHRASYGFLLGEKDIISLNFDKNSWSTNVQMNVMGLEVGSTKAVFYNDKNNEMFTMMFFVIP